MHMPYRWGYTLPGHHYEDRHDAPVYNRRCICELVGPNWFPYGIPDKFPGSPISIAIDRLMVVSLELPRRQNQLHPLIMQVWLVPIHSRARAAYALLLAVYFPICASRVFPWPAISLLVVRCSFASFECLSFIPSLWFPIVVVFRAPSLHCFSCLTCLLFLMQLLACLHLFASQPLSHCLCCLALHLCVSLSLSLSLGH